jgi:hypothetical protein
MATMRVDAEREFLDCYDATIATVYGYASRLAGDDPTTIESLVRDVYLDVLRRARERSLVEIEPGSLLTDVRGRVLGRLRDAPHDDGSPRLATGAARPVGGAVLTSQERVALTMRFVDELPTTEVASALDLTVRATDALVAKSRGRLRSRASDPDRWLDEMMPPHAPSPAFAAALRRQLLVGWGLRGATQAAPVPARSGGLRHVLLASAVAAAAVGLVVGAVHLADATSRRTVTSPGPVPSTVPSSPVTTAPVTVPVTAPSTTGPPTTAPPTTAPPTTAPPTTAPEVTEPSAPPTSATPSPDTVAAGPAIDLGAASLLGVRPAAPDDRGVDVDATVSAVAGAVGAPTGDTGWYRSTVPHGKRCRDDVERRVVQFGDAIIGFVRGGDGPDRVAAWTVGTDPDQVARHGLAAPLPEAPRLGIGWNDSELHFGTLAEIADAGFTIRFVDGSGVAVVPDDPALATRGEVLLDGGPDLGLRLYGGVVIGIDATTLPAC